MKTGDICKMRKKAKGGIIRRNVTSQLIIDEKRIPLFKDNLSNSPVRLHSFKIKSLSTKTPPMRGQGRPRKGEKLSLKTPPSLICSNEPAAYPPSSSGTSSRPLLYLLENSTLSHHSYKKLSKVKQVLRRIEGLLLE